MAEAGVLERDRWWRSVRVRVTAGATAVFAVAFVAAAVLLVNRVHASLEDEVRRESNDTVTFLKHELEAGTPINGLRMAVPNPSVGFVLVNEHGDIVEASGASAAAFELPVGEQHVIGPPPDGSTPPDRAVWSERPPPDQSEPRSVKGGGSASGEGTILTGVKASGEVISVFSEASTPQGPVTIAVASPLDGVRQSIDTLTRVLLLGTPLLVLVVGSLIFVFVGRALRPVDLLCAEVQAITHSTLHRRIAPAGANDEIDRLAHTMNDMLDRLEGAADQQKQFVSDASHELKTPLTTIRTSIEVAMRDPEHADWPAISRRVLAADAEMEDLVSDLLDLARLDELASATATGSAVVDLEELVLERLHDHAPHATKAQIDSSGVVAGRVRGDRRSLDRMVRNLVGNAVTHAGANVRVTLDEADGWVELTVDDDGPGVPLADRQRIFGRFARLEESRTASGTGLGLAIVKAVADRHGGTLAVGEAPLGGARFTVRLPSA